MDMKVVFLILLNKKQPKIGHDIRCHIWRKYSVDITNLDHHNCMYLCPIQKAQYTVKINTLLASYTVFNRSQEEFTSTLIAIE